MTETQPADLGGTADTRIYEGVDQLAAALAAVQAELPRVLATEDVDTGSYGYKYASLATVAAAILPLLGRNGLAFTAWPTLTEGRFVLRYQLLHKSGQSLTGEYPISGGNAQAVGSAITYARRYALSAVTGISPDQDDDAAAAVGAREVEQTEQRQDNDRERQTALDAVRGAWFNQYGEFNSTAAIDMYKTWSHGGELAAANPQQLRAFAAFLHMQPVADAGSTPVTEQEPPADTVRVLDDDGPKLGRKDNAYMFVAFEKLGMKDDPAAQREYLGRTLERPIESRKDVRQVEWPRLRAALDADVQLVERTGVTPNQPAVGDS